MKICILIGSHLATAPRAQKECEALAKAGCEVTVLGSWWNSALADEDVLLASTLGVSYKPLIDRRKSDIASTLGRIKGRIAREAFARLGLVFPRVLGANAPELLSAAKAICPDVVVSHCEAGLWASKELKRKGFKVGTDFEDWFSRDLLQQDRITRPVKRLSELERWHLRHDDFSITTSIPLASALALDAKASRIPVVIPNVFPWEERNRDVTASIECHNSDFVSIYWCSQTIGPGRGLEQLSQSLKSVRGNWRLRLRGRLLDAEWLNRTFDSDVRSRVDILPLVNNRDLLQHHSRHDIGLALEIPYCENKNLTISNKLFDYMRAGLALIATDTIGQKSVYDTDPNIGWLVKANDINALCVALQSAIDDPIALGKAKKASLSAAKERWNWGNYSCKLVDTILQRN